VNALDFAEPARVHLLWIVAALTALLLWLDARGTDQLRRLVAPSLMSRLVERPGSTRRRLRIALLTATGVFLTLALMRPQWGLRIVQTPQVGAEIMIALDVSRSMLADDAKPSRLERAKAEIADLLAYLDEDQVGLIAFAGRATVLAPLTPDFSFLRLVLDSASPKSVSRGGTRLEEPIRKAIDGFAKESSSSRSILLITDGEDQDSFPKEAAKAAAERGIKILAVGFGAETGSEITITDPKTGVRSPLRDSDGKPVRSRLDGAMLRDLALVTDGAYVPAGTGLLDLQAIYNQHIAGLTRGRMDGTTRQVRNEAFQWPLLLALAALLMAAGMTGFTGKTNGRKGSALALVLALLVSLEGSQAGEALAQGSGPPHASAPTAAMPALPPASEGTAEPTNSDDAESSDDSATDEADLLLRPDDARDAYNQALKRMNEGKLDRAAELYEHAREIAGTDVEVRSRATFNRAWIDIVRADTALEQSELEQTLTSLRGAADWFRRNLGLRPGDNDSRQNLEITLGRIQAIEDQLASADETPLIDRINALIERQRDFATTLAETMEASAANDTPAAIEALRPRFRMLASDELDILSSAEEVAEFGQREAAALAARDVEELEPSEAVRAIQLEGALALIQRARERIGQTRSRLRVLEAEPAWRRSIAAMDELKRARDQLLDPVTILDGLVSDSSQNLGLILGLATMQEPNYEGPKRPWLTSEFLSEGATTLSERIQALSEGFKAAVAQIESGQADPSAPTEPMAPEEEIFFEAMRGASLFLDDAVGSTQRAGAAAEESRLDAATAAQGQTMASLIDARERFLDLRRLIDLAVQEAEATRTVLENPESDGQGQATKTQAKDWTARNVDRGARIDGALQRELAKLDGLDGPDEGAGSQPQQQGTPSPEEVAAERQRLKLAKGYLAQARAALGRATTALAATALASENTMPAETAPPLAHPVDPALQQAEQVEDSLRDLQRLFFNVVEHLQDVLRRQVDLGDESEQASATMRTHPDEDHSATSGPLSSRQETLAATSGGIATALQEQSEQLRNADPSQAPEGGPSPQEQAQSVDTAATHVVNAQALMETATSDLASNPAPMADVRSNQLLAVEELSAALAALQPPQEDEEQDEQQDQEEEQGDQEEQPEDQQQDGEPQPQDQGQEEQQPPLDAAQALQGIRDREAERRAEQEHSDPSRYEPVERDW
jgi:Ca-activated chloride channel family protein